jgi:hypothetical protein
MLLHADQSLSPLSKPEGFRGAIEGRRMCTEALLFCANAPDPCDTAPPQTAEVFGCLQSPYLPFGGSRRVEQASPVDPELEVQVQQERKENTYISDGNERVLFGSWLKAQP